MKRALLISSREPPPGRVVPLSQIHSLRPSLQPRAWLDVMASAYTSRDDKNEAMQEILILAKDKVGASPMRVAESFFMLMHREILTIIVCLF